MRHVQMLDNDILCFLRILNEMKTIQGLLPTNSAAKLYVSVLINITQFVLESGQGK